MRCVVACLNSRCCLTPWAVQAVSAVSAGVSPVRYVLTESGYVVAGGAVASVLSTAAGPLEVLPFAVLDKLWPGLLQLPPVAAALYTILESPALRGAEAAVERYARIAQRKTYGEAFTG